LHQEFLNRTSLILAYYSYKIQTQLCKSTVCIKDLRRFGSFWTIVADVQCPAANRMSCCLTPPLHTIWDMETWTRPDFPQPSQPPTQAEFYHGLDLQDMMFFWGART
jgi:hypothetical protein